MADWEGFGYRIEPGGTVQKVPSNLFIFEMSTPGPEVCLWERLSDYFSVERQKQESLSKKRRNLTKKSRDEGWRIHWFTKSIYWASGSFGTRVQNVLELSSCLSGGFFPLRSFLHTAGSRAAGGFQHFSFTIGPENQEKALLGLVGPSNSHCGLGSEGGLCFYWQPNFFLAAEWRGNFPEERHQYFQKKKAVKTKQQVFTILPKMFCVARNKSQLDLI